MNKLIEEQTAFLPDFEKTDKITKTGCKVIPAIVQHIDTGEVLMLGYMNEKALAETLRSGHVTFWSTSRNELWKKGETSGNFLKAIKIRVNCEQNSLLILSLPEGEGVCHTVKADGKHRATCYYRELSSTSDLIFIAG